MPPFSVVVGAGAIKGIHVPHAEWVVPFYPVVLEVLQELVSIGKCWSFTLQPLPSHPSQMQTKWDICTFVRRNGIRQNGMTPFTPATMQDCQRLYKKGGLPAMLISLQSTMEFIEKAKGKLALIFNGSRFTLNRRMDNGICYWRCAKRTYPLRITTEGNDLKQQTAPRNHAVHVVNTQVKVIHKKKEPDVPGQAKEGCCHKLLVPNYFASISLLFL